MEILKSLRDLFKGLLSVSPKEISTVIVNENTLVPEEPKVCKGLEEIILVDSLSEGQDDDNNANESITALEKANIGEALDEIVPSDSLKKTESAAEEELVVSGKTESPVEEPPPPLLDNRPFVKLAEECVDMMNEFEGYIERLETREGKMMVELIVKRLQELLERSGLHRIDDETELFSVLRHIPIPIESVSEGTPLNGIIRAGLALENRVLRKAKVNVQNHK